MKKGIHYFALILLAGILMIGGTACMKNPEKQKSPATSGASSSPEILTKSDREIVEAVFSEWYLSLKKNEIVLWANDAMETAEELSGKLFGKITSEEDAKEKAEAVCVELGWSNDVELSWSNDIEDKNPYKIKFYDEYGVWMVDSFSPSNGVDSEGREYPAPPGSGYCTIMRKSDGKVLAAWIS